MFEYFPNHYSWNLGLLMAVQLGGELTEIDGACRPLIEISQEPGAKDDPKAQELWIRSWSGLARKLEAAAADEEAQGHRCSAGRRYRRACIYFMTAERMTSHHRPEKLEFYHSMLAAYRK